MALFLISYDLTKPVKDYPDLTAALMRLKARRVLYSEWVVDTSTDIQALFNHIRTNGKMDNNDGLLVVEIADWVSINTMAPVEFI